MQALCRLCRRRQRVEEACELVSCQLDELQSEILRQERAVLDLERQLELVSCWMDTHGACAMMQAKANDLARRVEDRTQRITREYTLRRVLEKNQVILLEGVANTGVLAILRESIRLFGQREDVVTLDEAEETLDRVSELALETRCVTERLEEDLADDMDVGHEKTHEVPCGQNATTQSRQHVQRAERSHRAHGSERNKPAQGSERNKPAEQCDAV